MIGVKMVLLQETDYGCLFGPCLQENAMATDENTADHRRNRPSSHDMDLSGDDHVPKVLQFPAQNPRAVCNRPLN